MAYYNSVKIFNILSKFNNKHNALENDKNIDTNINTDTNKLIKNENNLNGGNTKLLFSDLIFDFDNSDDNKFEGGNNDTSLTKFTYDLNNSDDFSENNTNTDMFLPKIISKINISSSEEEIKKDLENNEDNVNYNKENKDDFTAENMSLAILEEIYGRKFEDDEDYTPISPDDEITIERSKNENYNSKNEQSSDDFVNISISNNSDNIYNMYGGAELNFDDSLVSLSSSSDSSTEEEYENDYIASTNRFNENNNDSIYNIEIESLSDSENNESSENEENEENEENKNNQTGGESVNNIISNLGDNKDNDDIKAYIKGCKTKGLIGGITKNKVYKFNFYPYN